MKALLRAEVRKAFMNRWCVFAFAVGTVLALVSAAGSLVDYFDYLAILPKLEDKYANPYLYSCYVYWMSVDPTQTSTWLFYRLAPLLAVFPYSWSLGWERNSHYVDQLYIRQERKKILLSKYLVAFLVGGAVVLLPQVVNFMALACFVPAYTPEVFDALYSGIFYDNLFSELFYTMPLAYVGSFCLISFTLCGLWSGFVLGISAFVDNRVAVLVAPYLVLLVMQFLNERVFSALGGIRGVQLSLFENLHAGTIGYVQNGWFMCAEAFLLLVASAVLLACFERRDRL